MGNKKNEKKRLKGLIEQSITMSSFLMRILGIKNEELMKEELTHQELAKIFPDLKRTSYDHILDDPQCVYSGNVILVRDVTNSVIPYIIGEQFYMLDDIGMSEVMTDEDWHDLTPETWSRSKTDNAPNINDYDLKSMSVYDLERLLRIYNQTHQVGNYQKVRRELISRSDSIQGNRASKQKVLHKKQKYQRRELNEYDY